MGKAVLISIQPKWCELIASGKKTIEVRKTKPKLATPFKVYIYCTKDEPLYHSGEKFVCGEEFGNGKVVGEFVCDTFIIDKTFGHDALFRRIACMNDAEAAAYCTNGEMYGWHISNLVIYDEPKELGEFYIIDKEAVQNCKYRFQTYHQFTDTGYIKNGFACNYKDDWCTKCKTKPLKRPPQSWCYVESEVDTV